MDTVERYEKLKRERRYIVVPIDVNLLGETFRDGTYHYKAEGIPKDAIFVAAERDILRQDFQFIYLHESFDQVPEGQAGPTMYLTLTKLGDKNE